MIYLILTILQSTAIFVVLKLFNRFKIDNWQALTINYIVATGFGFIIYNGKITPEIIIGKDWFEFALILGATFISTFFIFALSSQRVGVALTSVASKMSVVIPVIAGLLLLQEEISLLAAIGVVVALLAFYLTLGGGKHRSFPRKYVILPLLLFLGNGINDTLMKYSEHHFVSDTNDLTLFLSVIFLTSLVLGLFISGKRYVEKKQRITWHTIVGGSVLGLINFGSTFYILKAMGIYTSSVVFPVTNAGVVTLSALVGFLFFREKLSSRNWIGIFLAILAILLIANA
ncbi:MAG: EamA/RhaT family transporter [Bacteroidetes bacterium]|nr:MAG: EamA/RhaT family transporter [Bacteroidota bacterium]